MSDIPNIINTSKIENDINQAVQALKSDGLVAFPTETVYGLGADAENLVAIKKVFSTKNRPKNHPLIVHIASKEKMKFWATNISEVAYTLARAFWPGPLTLILPKKKHVSISITGGQDTIALRVPNHPVTLKLLQHFNGMVGPSANKFGHVSPTTAKHVYDDFKNEIDFILDGGQCQIGIESTIVDCTNNSTIKILRHGDITKEEIDAVLNTSNTNNLNIEETSMFLGSTNSTAKNTELKKTARAPGMLKSHYAPKKPLVLLESEELRSFLNKLNACKQKFAVVSFSEKPNNIFKNCCYWQQIEYDAKLFAHKLYANIRALDKLDVHCLIIEKPPKNEKWQAIMERLKKASAKSKSYLKGLHYKELS